MKKKILKMISVMLNEDNSRLFLDIKASSTTSGEGFRFRYKNHTFEVGMWTGNDDWGNSSKETYFEIVADETSGKGIVYSTTSELNDKESRILIERLFILLKEKYYRIDEIYNDIIAGSDDPAPDDVPF